MFLLVCCLTVAANSLPPEARRRAEVLSGGNKRKLSAALALAWVTHGMDTVLRSEWSWCPRVMCLCHVSMSWCRDVSWCPRGPVKVVWISNVWSHLVPYAPDIVYLVHAQTYPCNSLASFCLWGHVSRFPAFSQHSNRIGKIWLQHSYFLPFFDLKSSRFFKSVATDVCCESEMGSPALAILDEPSCGLDPAARRALWSGRETDL